MTGETSETGIGLPRAAGDRPSAGLRFTLASGTFSIPLRRIHHLAGYATLSGEPDDYFLGWLEFRGQAVPVFDLNRIVCDQPSLALMGTRILILDTSILDTSGAGPTSAAKPLLGLLAPGVTDTAAPGDPGAPPLDLRAYLPMLFTLIPDPPKRTAGESREANP